MIHGGCRLADAHGYYCCCCCGCGCYPRLLIGFKLSLGLLEAGGARIGGKQPDWVVGGSPPLISVRLASNGFMLMQIHGHMRTHASGLRRRSLRLSPRLDVDSARPGSARLDSTTRRNLQKLVSSPLGQRCFLSAYMAISALDCRRSTPTFPLLC